MTFLPIVDRELRVAARRRGTYSIRLFVALIAILTGSVIFLVNLGASQQAIGRNIFLGLSILSMIYCVSSGRISTADCLSEEKREGTLGLLFLTDLKGYDVVLGKLAATSLNAFYGLLALLPVLALPLLLGGVTNGEFSRVVLVLVNTFLFSLSIGIFGSALSREARRAMAANFGLLILFMAALPVGLTWLLYSPYPLAGGPPVTLMSCPFYSFYFCDHGNYKAHAILFWWSAAVIHGLTWLLLALASWLIPRAWQDKPEGPARTPKRDWRALWRAWSYGNPAKLPLYRRELLDVNAYYWLAARARLKPAHVWTFFGLLTCWWIYVWLKSRLTWFDFPLLTVVPALILNATIKAWIALEASQQLAEDQKAGSLELLLSTPLTGRDILRGQYLALRRQFLKPMLLIIAVGLIFMTAQLHNDSSGDRSAITSFWLAGIVMLIADVLTLPYVALRAALTSKNPHRAAVSTISIVLILPWAIFGIGSILASLWSGLFSNSRELPGWRFHLALWFGAGMSVDLLFGLNARRQLLHKFHALAIRQFAPPPSRSAARMARRQTAATVPRPDARLAPGLSPRKKALLFGFVLALLIGGALFNFRTSEPPLPPPPLVSISQSNGPLRVFSGGPFHLILPDHSLWRWDASYSFNSGLEFRRAAFPERIGVDCDWLQIAGIESRNLLLRSDGTLWRWWHGGFLPAGAANVDGLAPTPGLSPGPLTRPDPVDGAHDWVSISTRWGYSVAIKNNGTLWGWNDDNHSRSVIQIGTNTDWIAATCLGTATLGLRADGTLWIWGLVGRPGAARSNLPIPVQFCQETNWTALEVGFGFLVWNSAGEVWQPNLSSVIGQAPASATCQFISSNAPPGGLAAAICPTPKLYEARRDGTLWERHYSLPGWPAPPDLDWHRVGKRTDWVALWGHNGTALGLTADNTLWTWGIDPSQELPLTFASRVQRLKLRINERLGIRMPPSLRPLPLQITPRPLLRMAFPTHTNTISLSK